MPNIYLSKVQYTTCIIISCRLIFCYKLQISIILIYNGTHTYKLLATNTSHKTKQGKKYLYDHIFFIYLVEVSLAFDLLYNNVHVVEAR